jgi:hypothetical protein
MTAFSPGQSPPPVSSPMRAMLGGLRWLARARPSGEVLHSGDGRKIDIPTQANRVA